MTTTASATTVAYEALALALTLALASVALCLGHHAVALLCAHFSGLTFCVGLDRDLLIFNKFKPKIQISSLK